VSVVRSGLDNPRDVTFWKGHLYVAEAGHGGTDCPEGAETETGPLCAGLTGKVSEITGGSHTTVIDNLISLGGPPGIAALGPEAVTPTNTGLRVAMAESTVGILKELPEGSSFNEENSAAIRSQLGRVAEVGNGTFQDLADVGDADYIWTAVHQDLVPSQFPDANPNALLIRNGITYVIDAGANTLNAVDAAGHVTELAFFPNIGNSDSVPTCIARGPDNNFYIGELAPDGGVGGSSVFKYEVATGKVSVWKTGFTAVDGCSWDTHGNFYVVELQSNGFNPSPTGNPAGAVVKIAKDGTQTRLGEGKLFFPQNIAFDSSGDLYVSNWSLMPATPAMPGGPTGEVVKIDL